MKISEIACATDVPAKTIRYYEQVGLLAAPKRQDNGYRFYDLSQVDTLVFIRRCRELNIAIGDIKRLLDAQKNPKGSCSSVDEIISEQLARVQQTQKELALLESSLLNLASSCENSHIEDCKILQQLNG